MMPLDNPQAEPLPISDREFDQYAERGYATSERDGRRIVHVPTATYEAHMEQAMADYRKAVAKRRTKERNRRHERSKQRKLARS
jgi:hypothetical protein